MLGEADDRRPWALLKGLGGPLPPSVRYRVPLYHPDFPFILFWSQKAGCTTVVKWFFAQLGLLEEALAHSPWVHNYEIDVYKRRPGYKREVYAALRAGSHAVVKIVRDPTMRAPSAFLVLAERGAVGQREHWVQRHWRLVDDWLAARGLDPARGISFLDHLAMVRDLKSARPETLNAHLAPQHVAGEEAFVGSVVPIEGFAAWTETVAGEGKVARIDVGALAGSKHHHSVDPQRTAALGACPESVPIVRGAYADGRFPAAAAFVNERSRASLEAAYAEDFAAYGAHYASTDDALR